MYFASAEPAVRESTWVLETASIIVLLLLVFAIYLIIRALLTKSPKLALSPLHIQRATAILRWIAYVAPALMLLGAFSDSYSQMMKAAIQGTIEPWRITVWLMGFMVQLGVGIVVSLSALIGTALIFMKRLRYERRERSLPD